MAAWILSACLCLIEVGHAQWAATSMRAEPSGTTSPRDRRRVNLRLFMRPCGRGAGRCGAIPAGSAAHSRAIPLGRFGRSGRFADTLRPPRAIRRTSDAVAGPRSRSDASRRRDQGRGCGRYDNRSPETTVMTTAAPTAMMKDPVRSNIPSEVLIPNSCPAQSSDALTASLEARHRARFIRR